jgi:hypothetical protein
MVWSTSPPASVNELWTHQFLQSDLVCHIHNAEYAGLAVGHGTEWGDESHEETGRAKVK